MLKEGIIAGLLGAAAVAVWFLALDLIFRDALYTPAALWSAFFEAARGPADVEIGARTVLGYTVAHVLIFLVLGVIVSALIRAAAAYPPFLLGIALYVATFEVAFFGVVLLLGRWVLDILGIWSLLLGNLIAALVMLGYLWKRHPSLAGALEREEPLEADGEAARMPPDALGPEETPRTPERPPPHGP